MMNQAENIILKNLKNGDRSAFQVIFSKYYQSLYIFAQKFVSQGAKGLDNSPMSMFGVGVMIILGNAIGRRVGVRVNQNDSWIAAI